MLRNRLGGARGAIALLTGVTVAGGSAFLGAGAASAATVPDPAIKSLSVTSGSTAGGDTITINGAGFSAVTLDGDDAANAENAVMFKVGDADPVAGTNFKKEGSGAGTKLKVTVPALEEGEGAAVVIVHAGEKTSSESAAKANTFTYRKPLTASMASDVLANPLGGTSITVDLKSGDDAYEIAKKDFAGHKITAKIGTAVAKVAWKTTSSITVAVPAGTPSGTAAKVSVLHDGVAGTADESHLKFPAVITKLSAVSGTLAGGATVKVTGKGLTGATEWKFGTIDATCSVKNDTSAECTVPVSESGGAVSVKFTPAGGDTAATLAYTTGSTYTYTTL